MVTWLLVARPGVFSIRSRYSVKAAGVTINIDIGPDGAAGDARGDIAEVDIMLD